MKLSCVDEDPKGVYYYLRIVKNWFFFYFQRFFGKRRLLIDFLKYYFVAWYFNVHTIRSKFILRQWNERFVFLRALHEQIAKFILALWAKKSKLLFNMGNSIIIIIISLSRLNWNLRSEKYILFSNFTNCYLIC